MQADMAEANKIFFTFSPYMENGQPRHRDAHCYTASGGAIDSGSLATSNPIWIRQVNGHYRPDSMVRQPGESVREIREKMRDLRYQVLAVIADKAQSNQIGNRCHFKLLEKRSAIRLHCSQ